MYQTRTSMSAVSSNHRSGNGPLSSLSPNSPRRPLLPLYASFDNARSSRRRYHSRRHFDPGLTQMMMNHRGSLLSTASLALIGAGRRPSAELDEEQWKKEIRLSDDRVWSRTKKCIQRVYEKSHFKNFLPLLILVSYSFLGGAVVYWIEAPIETIEIEGKQKFLNDQKESLVQKVWETVERRLSKKQAIMNLREAVHWYTMSTMYMDANLTRLPPPTTEVVNRVEILKKYTAQMAERCWEIRLESFNRSDVKRKLETSLKLFELFTGVTTEVKPIWTFSNALFLAVTIYTTIGYGSVAPHTVAGRVATIIYAIIGIPVYLMILHKLGRVFLKLLHGFWNLTLKFANCAKCFKRSYSEKKATEKVTESGQRINTNLPQMKENDYNIPVSLAVGVTFAWMLTCAGVCCLFFETSWDYFTSFYFFFISLTTIGFGDVTPTHPEYMFTMFGLIIVGLSLVSMCINVVQLKLELLFEEMMLALMEEYENSGRTLDGEMMESALFQRGLGFVQMMKLWTRKKRANENPSDFIGTFPFPFPSAVIKRRGAFLRELQRRRRARTVGTQTDCCWRTMSYDELQDWQREIPPWMEDSFRRRRLKKLLLLHEATQTDLSDFYYPDTVVNVSTSGQCPPYDAVDSTRSASSSMLTCEDNAASVAYPVTIGEADENRHWNESDRSDEEDAAVIKTESVSENDESDGSGSATSPDLIPFIPYIEQEVPLEQEQDQPFRRWSAAEAMSVFANWAAARALRKQQSRQSRFSSEGDEYEDERQLAKFQNMGKARGRRVTVAVGVPQDNTTSFRRKKRLDQSQHRTGCTPTRSAVSTMRIASREPSRNDMRPFEDSKSTKPTVTRHALAVDSSLESKNLGSRV